MHVYTYSEARQKLAVVLEQAFSLTPARYQRKSALAGVQSHHNHREFRHVPRHSFENY